MRLKEITQLRKEDIIKIDNIPCISIDANEDKTTKTKKSISNNTNTPKTNRIRFLRFC